jgi:hypothetical protein
MLGYPNPLPEQSIYKYAIEKYISDYPRDEGNSSRTEKPTAMISLSFRFEQNFQHFSDSRRALESLPFKLNGISEST